MSQITDTVDELELEAALTAFDRCDSCGAQAYIRVTLASGDLLFCAHHGAKFKEKLAPDRSQLARRDRAPCTSSPPTSSRHAVPTAATLGR